jgi:hypothetical protein
MAITQAVCSSFKQELLEGIQDMDADTFKMALYTSSATLGATTTVYSATNEVSGTGYTAGGATITSPTVTLSGTTAFFDCADVTWTTATLTARGAVIYNSSKANRTVLVLDFGSDKTSTAGDFSVIMPTPDASNALLRLS